MPTSALWTLIGSLILLALGLTYKWVENAHGLKLSEKEADRLRAALDALEETRKNESIGYSKDIAELKEEHKQEIFQTMEMNRKSLEELTKKIAELTVGSNTEQTSEVKYLITGSYKWAVTVHKSGNFSLDKYPICTIHDLKFIFGTRGKYCPDSGCNNRLSEYDEFKVHETVKSIVERNIRNNEWQLV